MISQRRIGLRHLCYAWSVLVRCAGPVVGIAAYSYLTLELAAYAFGSVWWGLLYLPAAVALLNWRRTESLLGWPGGRWRALWLFGAVVYYGVCWYGAMLGTALWRFG